MDATARSASEPALKSITGEDSRERAWPEISGVGKLLEQATQVLAGVRNQAEALRRRAYTDGHEAGFAKAQADAVRHLLDAQRLARDFLNDRGAQVVELAVSIVERIAPDLGEERLVPALVSAALRELRTHHSVCVRVNSGAVADATREMLAKQHRWDPTVDVAVLVDPQVGRFGCIVESSLGRMDMGLAAQLAKTRGALLAQRESGAPPSDKQPGVA